MTVTVAPTRCFGLRVLVADADPTVRETIANAIRSAGCEVDEVGHGRDAIELLRARDMDAIVCDVDLPRAGGRDLLTWLARDWPDIDAIMTAKKMSLTEAVAAVKAGATDYLLKPLDLELLLLAVERVAQRLQLERQVASARRDMVSKVLGPAIIGQSISMRRLFERLEKMARSQASILIRGESGTGKELVARLIHQRSPRASKPFVAVNCAAFPETLLEAELFGHEKGAFTGAHRKRIGRFQAAHQGTLFLDEVAEIPLSAQAKLLRVLQEGVIEPLGSQTEARVDVRIVSATHRDLKKRMSDGLFREDLYFRLKVLEAVIPPLRDRSGDIPMLVQHFLQRFTMAEPLPTITHRAWDALKAYPFPGNVRELEHAIQHAVILAENEIDLVHLPTEISGEDNLDLDDDRGFPSLAEAVRECERHHLIRALHLADGNRTRTSELLGISRKNLWEKLKLHGLSGISKTKPPHPL